MQTVVQRVHEAAVRAGGRTVGRIGRGLVAFVAVEQGDGPAELEWTARKLTTLRLFSGADGKLDETVADVGGEVLMVSNFTVAGRVAKGTRPDFSGAAGAEPAFDLFEALCRRVADAGVPMATGEFGADMEVDVLNDGPVTLVLTRRPREAA